MRYVSIALSAALGAVAVLAVAVPARANPASEAIAAEAQTLAEGKQYAEAAEKLEAAVSADGNHAKAWFQLASARRHSGRCDRAVVAYRRYIQLAATQPEPHYGLALCLRELGERAAAIQEFKHYISVEKRPEAQTFVQKSQAAIAELSGAGADAASKTPPAGTVPPAAKGPAAAPANPAYVEAQALRDRGHIEEAIVKFKQAIAADPRAMPPRAALGELLLKIRRDDEAIDAFRAALEKNPTYPLAWYDLAFAYRTKGRMAEAVDAYERYIKLRPGDPDPYYGLGRALQQLGKNAAARQAYETYISLEKHPSEKRWVESAQLQLRTLATSR